MADVKFTVEGKGKNLKKTAQEAGDIGKNVDASNAALDRAGGKQDAYNRREKGIFQTNLSSGKAYSKLAQNIGGGGSSSLVGAYATLAANVFALSAAFHALRDAAQFEQLVEGLNAVGDSAGRNLGHLGERLKDITDNAISAERAMRAVAVGTSAGFSAVQLEKLTTVAKGASIALGRDMGDAMDRLVRGAAKLEPEILDELGIMVRLDEATENYAAKIGKTAAALTQYERRQAFINAINEQGLEKFEEIAASVDPVAYDQLAASLNNLGKAFLGLINGALRPFIDLLANSQAALIGATALFGSTITRQMLPALHNMAGNARQAAKQFAEMNPVITKNIVTSGKLPAAYKKIGKSIKDGTASIEEMAEGQEILNRSQSWYQNMVDKGESHPDYKKNVAGLKNVTKAAEENEKVLKGRLGTLARIQSADALTMAQFGSLRDGWGKLNEGIRNNSLDIDANIEAEGRSITMKDKAGKAAFKYGQRVKFVGAAFVNALPWIGLFTTAAGVLIQVWNSFNPGNALKEAADEAMKAFDRLEEINEKLLRNTAKTNDELKIMRFQYEALGGVLNTVVDVVGEVGQAVFKVQNEQITKIVTDMLTAQRLLDSAQEDLRSAQPADTAFFSGRLAKAEERLQKQKDLLKEIKDGYGKVGTDGVVPMTISLQKAIVQAEIFSKRNAGLGAQIIQTLKQITVSAEDNIADKQLELQNALSPINSYNDAVKNASQITAEFVKQRNKLFQVDTTPFDDLEETLSTMKDSFAATEEMAKVSKGRVAVGMGISRPETLAEAQERLNKALVEELNLRDILGIKTKQEFDTFFQDFEKRNKEMRDHKGKLESLKAVEKEVMKIRKASFFSQVEGLQMLNKATEERRKAEEQDLKNQRDQLNSTIQHLTIEMAFQDDRRKNKKLSEEEQEEANKKFLSYQAQVRKNSKKQDVLDAQIIAKQNEKLTVAQELAREEVARLEDKKVALKLEQDMFKLLQKARDLEATRARNAMMLANLSDKRRRASGDVDLDAAQEFQLAARTRQQRERFIKLEFNMAVKRINLEHNLLKAKIEMQKADNDRWLKRYELENKGDLTGIKEAREINKAFTDAADAYINGMGPLLQERLRLAKLEKDVALETLDVEMKKAKFRAQNMDAFGKGSGSRVLGGGTGAAGVDFVAGILERKKARIAEEKAVARTKAEEEQSALIDKRRASFGFPKLDTLDPTDPARISADKDIQAAGQSAADAVTKASLFSKDTGITERLTTIRSLTAGLNEELKKLGPEGEVAAAVGSGMLNMGTSISAAIDTIESDTDKTAKVAAGFAAVASVINSISQIMAASSRARIAAVDKEIAAEKKRDGKSKASLKKLQQLEAKKEQLERKAFNRQKKMQMASAVASTAAAVAGALGAPPPGPWNIALAALIGAMGLAQLAIISGTSYEGGGTGGNAGAGISQINMGERNNKVDISGGRANVAGEVSYLRGARGSGTSAADFRPAFAGRKYRAAGGAAYVVGEQGPELFVPSVPGRVVSNDDMETATPSNVNFTINAIDAAGVEEVLVEQRGNIIGMLRESANEYGTGFLEEVNEDAYTSTTEGSVYGRA